MGSYISTTKFFELPFRTKKLNPNNRGLIFSLKTTNEEIIEVLSNSNLNHIQTTTNPSDDELIIINEVLKKNSNIAFRHYFGFGVECADISYLLKLTHLKHLYLDLYCKIQNIDVIQKLDLESLALSCFNVKEYSFLRNVSPKIKYLTIELEDKTYKMDINDIIHMKELESLGLRNVKNGLDKLIHFQSLNELYLRSVSIKDYSFLQKMNVKKIYLGFQNVEYFDTFGINESIEEVSLWMNKKLTDLSFLLQFPNLKRVIISNQNRVEIIPNLKKLQKLEEIYFLDSNPEEIKKYCNSNVKIYSQYNPADIS